MWKIELMATPKSSGPKRFDVGDLVVLKSGGPVMTIRDIAKTGIGTIFGYSCQWFAGKKLESGSFPFESVEAAPKQAGKK